jgi:hypothetical protein
MQPMIAGGFRSLDRDWYSASVVAGTFLHEQQHWLEGPGLDVASRRWPDPPPPAAEARDKQSTWLHVSACALEFQSLSEIVGPALAAAELRALRPRRRAAGSGGGDCR